MNCIKIKFSTCSYRWILCLLFGYFYAPISTSAQLALTDSLLHEQLFEKVEQHCYTKLDSTFYYLDSIENFVCRLDWSKGYIDVLSWKAFVANYHKQLDLSYDYLKQTEQAILSHQEELGNDFKKIWQDNQSRLSNYYFEIGYFSKTLTYANTIIGDLLQQDSLSRNDFRQLIISHLFIGTVYKKQGNYDAAIENFLYCINYEKQRAAKENRTPSYKSTLYRLAEVYRLKGDYHRSRSHYLEALEAMLGQFDEQAPSADRYRDYIISYYYGLAQLYEQQDMLDSAHFYLKKSINFHQKDSPSFMNTYHHLGKILMAQQQYDQADFYLKKSLHLKKRKLGKEKNYQLAQTYQALGDLHQQQQNLEMALSYYDLAMASLTHQNNLSIEKEPQQLSFHQLYAPKDALAVLNEQIATLYQIHHQKTDTISLKTALKKTKVAVQLMDNIRLHYNSDEDKQFLNEKSYAIFERGIEIANQLGANYLSFAFLLAEKSKSIVLHETLHKTYQDDDSNIPETLLHQQYQLKYQLGKLKDQRQEALAKNTDAATIQTLQLKQFKLNRQYEQVLKQINIVNTGNCKADFLNSHLSVQDVQQDLLQTDETLIEYFLGANTLYIFVITKDDFQIKTSALNFPIEEWSIQLKEYILNHKNNLYVQTAHQLYKKLIAPIEDSLLHHNLIIVPDGVLGYIPFEALLTQDIPVSKNYKDYPYLLQSHAISYCFSASLLQTMQQLQHLKVQNQVLAIAPSFRALKTANLSPIAQRSALSPLSQNIPEVQDICRLNHGHSLIGTEATLERFLALAPNYRVLHLASHGKTKANTNYSYIAFSNLIDTAHQDYKLYVKDLYRLRLSADLVVLSACETGLGKVQQGEGILSLARAFSYAGAKSIITTLWNIDDYSTKTLMQYFYQYLQAGKSKNEALRLAKLDYIANSPRIDAHPAYWAAFVAVGDMNAITLDQSPERIWWIVGGMMVLASLVFLFLKHKDVKMRS